jgi:hypothetical protein
MTLIPLPHRIFTVSIKISQKTKQSTVYARGAQISQQSRSHLKILGARRVTETKFHTEDPQILGVTVQTVVATATWRLGFVVHPWYAQIFVSFAHLHASDASVA